MLTISRTTPLRPARRMPVRASRTRTATHASLRDAADWLAAGFMKIFTPPTDSGVNWKGTSTGYSGVVNRRQNKRHPEPVVSQQEKTMSEQGEVFAMDTKEEQPASNVPEAAEYISGALQRVMDHNFVGDETEPEWNEASGWSGDVRARRERDRDGFHSKKL